MEMERIYAEAASSVAHVYGNVAKAMEIYIKGRLPQNYLKDCNISTRVAYRHFQRRRNRKASSSNTKETNQLNKPQKPYLTIRPTVSIIGAFDDLFLNGTHITNFDGGILGPGKDIQEVLSDKVRGIGVGFRINRYRFSFEFELKVSTSYEGYDIYNYLKNNMTWELPQYIRTPLESKIPSNIVYTIAKYIGVDIDKEHNIATMLQYMQKHSAYPITYMMNNATSRDEFFVYYIQNLLVTFSELNISDNDKKNMVEDTSTVSFQATCDFNLLASYYLYGKNKIKDKIQSCIHYSDQPLNSLDYIPLFTYNYFDMDKAMELSGFTQYCNVVIKTDNDKDGKDDEFSIREFLPDEDYQVYIDYLAHGNPIELLFRAKVIKERADLDNSMDYEVDWQNLKVTIHNSDKFAMYRFIMYVNPAFLMEKRLKYGYDKTDQQTIESDTKHGYKVE